MKKIFNTATIISTCVLNFIKAADKSIPEKNIFLYIDGVEYKAKEEDNGNVNTSIEDSIKEFLKKRINDKKNCNDVVELITHDFFMESSMDGKIYTKCDWKNANFLKFYFFKKNEVDDSKLKINNNKFTEKKIKSLEILKLELKNLEENIEDEDLEKSKLGKIYEFLYENKIAVFGGLIVSYKIDGNETKIGDFITIDDLEKIINGIIEKKQVDITNKNIQDRFYKFPDNYTINPEKIPDDKRKNIVDIVDLFNNKYSTIYALSDEELKEYLKEKLGIKGDISIGQLNYESNDYFITLPDEYLLCIVKLSFFDDKNYEEEEDDKKDVKTLKYDYLNQLQLNKVIKYPKGTKYSELEKYIQDKFKFLELKKYKLDYYDSNDNECKDIKSDDEIESNCVHIHIKDEEDNNDLYEDEKENIKNLEIIINEEFYIFHLESVKNKDILGFIKIIISNQFGKEIDNFEIKYSNETDQVLNINNDDNDLDKQFYSNEKNIHIKVYIKEKEKKKDNKKDNGGNEDNKNGNDDEKLNSEQTKTEGKDTETDKTKEKNKHYSGY